MASDNELLRRYTNSRSEEAFAELVRRHLNLVYFAALRRANGDASLAEEVAQFVFITLAREARMLERHAVLTGWLYVTTRHAAAKAMRAERRRKIREQEARAMQETSSTPTPAADWNRLRPALDAVMDDLSDRDRDAVLLRFFENRPFAEIGAALRLSEDAVRMRIERALDKLRARLSRRGITSTTAALALALEQPAGIAAPVGLAASINGAVAAIGATEATAAIGFSFFHFMSTSKIAVGVISLIAFLGIGTALYEAGKVRDGKAAMIAADKQQDGLRAKLRDEESRLQASEEDNANLRRTIEVAGAGKPAQTSAATGSVTKAAVDLRYKHGLELASAGQAEEALKDLLWCYDEGFPQISAYRYARNRTLLPAIARLGDQSAGALAALRERRDAAGERILADAYDFEAVADFTSINSALYADDLSLEFYDQMAPDDPRRSAMVHNMYDQFVGAQRYREALQAQPYAQMSAAADGMARSPSIEANNPNREEILKSNHDYLIATTTKNIEVLAGAGDLAHARILVGKLLVYDGSYETRTVLQQHVERAGHPELLISP